MLPAKTVIDAALTKLGIKAIGVDVTEEQYTQGVFALNNFMVEADAATTKVGYSIVLDKNDDTTIPDYAVSFVVNSLAVELSSDYQVEVPPAVVAAVNRGKKAVDYHLTELETSIAYPENLPLGNHRSSGRSFNRRFAGNPRANYVEDHLDELLDDDGTNVEGETVNG